MSLPGQANDVVYDEWTLQLAPLASQHHLSEYNRLKYGHKGSPVSYSPLSLHLPDFVRALRARQQKYANQPGWWPCPSDIQSSPVIPAAKQRAALATGESIPHPDLQQELSIAISESITFHPRPVYIKTSESHPINISQIIPPESLVAISSHMKPCKKPRPVLFESHFPCSPDLLHVLPTPSNEFRSPVTGAALGTKISFPPLPAPSSRILLSLKRTFKGHSPERDVVDAIQKSAPRHSPSRLPSVFALSTTYALHPFLSHARPPTAPSPPNRISRLRASKSPSFKQDTGNRRPFRLGNLLLSSCPGKKVRLSGPVRGRGAVSRDLETDIRRIKMLGARCIVCCLDDEELRFLVGASWSEYCTIAHQEGLDVLRLPLPEGLVPLSPRVLDADLDRIIERYTLQGTSVLVHCRGGVGRAGVFACCWMLKLGLCGWVETDVASGVSELKHDHDTFRWGSETVVRRDTFQMVERVIEVVRRRRSVKAIETLEQVQFLVEYVDYLRASERDSGNSGNSQLPS